MGEDGQKLALIECAPNLQPAPGQYMLIHALDAPVEQATGWTLFPAGEAARGFFTGIPPDAAWSLETRLRISGPHGQGFDFPLGIRTLAVVSLTSTPNRLFPLIQQALRQKTDIALFLDEPSPALPPAVEIQPLSALSDALDWADFLAVDLSIDAIQDFRPRTGLAHDQALPHLARALVYTPMPCAGVAECGVCAVRTRRSRYQLACKAGPVFDMSTLPL